MHDIIGLLAVTGIFVIPSLALAGHFVLRPMLETYLRAKGLDRAPVPVDNARLTQLEERVSQMQESIDRLSEAVDFHMQLQAGAGASAGKGPAQLPGA